MNKEIGLQWGMKQAAGTVWTATEAVGGLAETIYDRLAPTREMLWYQLTALLRGPKIRQRYGRSFRRTARFV